MESVFNKQDSEEFVARINKLNAQSEPQWGKMNAPQMLAHCNVVYEFAYEDKHKKPGRFKKWILKMIAKPIVVSEKPYKKNNRTAPEFLMAGDKDFDAEKKRLLDYIKKTQQLGEDHFEGRESHSFGPLTSDEWNIMFAKHLNHHLNQFDV
jgi:hypothetical protein